MKKNSRSIVYSGAYTSPGTPEYGDTNGGGGGGEMAKSWSSERVVVASPTNLSIRRHVSAAALMPFNSGRQLPSKWDDAERWITSPVSSYTSAKSPVPQPPRRPQSKSGPLGGHPGFMGISTLTTGVIVPDGLSIHYNGGIVVESNSLCDESNVTSMSGSVPGLSDLISETSRPSSSQDDKPHGSKEEGPISHGVNHRDMATQMSPDGSSCSSSRGRLSFSDLPSSAPSSLHQTGDPTAKDEVRDVQVDKRITTTGQSKKQGEKKMKDSSHDQEASLPWNASESSKSTTKLQREEAKITAWENLQKARADAAIRKLEMKLEKKRSASMDKILNKFRASQMKAQTMRNLLSESDAPEAHTSSRSGSSTRKYVKLHLRSSCFICHRS